MKTKQNKHNNLICSQQPTIHTFVSVSILIISLGSRQTRQTPSQKMNTDRKETKRDPGNRQHNSWLDSSVLSGSPVINSVISKLTFQNSSVYKPFLKLVHKIIVQELCESRGGRPELSVLTSLLASVDVKIYWTRLRHWSQFVPNMSSDIRGH